MIVDFKVIKAVRLYIELNILCDKREQAFSVSVASVNFSLAYNSTFEFTPSGRPLAPGYKSVKNYEKPICPLKFSFLSASKSQTKQFFFLLNV